MADSNSVTFTLGYKDTDFTRQLKIDDVEAGALSSIKQNILDFNASISGGLSAAGLSAAAGLSSFFISDDFDLEEGIGYFTGIVAAQINRQSVTDIDLN